MPRLQHRTIAILGAAAIVMAVSSSMSLADEHGGFGDNRSVGGEGVGGGGGHSTSTTTTSGGFGGFPIDGTDRVEWSGGFLIDGGGTTTTTHSGGGSAKESGGRTTVNGEATCTGRGC